MMCLRSPLLALHQPTDDTPPWAHLPFPSCCTTLILHAQEPQKALFWISISGLNLQASVCLPLGRGTLSFQPVSTVHLRTERWIWGKSRG